MDQLKITILVYYWEQRSLFLEPNNFVCSIMKFLIFSVDYFSFIFELHITFIKQIFIYSSFKRNKIFNEKKNK